MRDFIVLIGNFFVICLALATSGCQRGDVELSLPANVAQAADADSGRQAPGMEVEAPVTLPVATATGLPAISGFTVNGRIQPRGLPGSWYVEYGRTSEYGSKTSIRQLPGKLSAHFVEDWAEGPNAWLAGMSGKQLMHHASGGPDDGPFLRYTDDQAAGNDVNHVDGVGLIHLGPYIYPGNYYWADVPPLYLGGGSPDLRGAKVAVHLRGVDWQPNGTEIGSWIQGYRDHSVVEVLPQDSRYPNWAFTGQSQNERLASGKWELAEWVFRNRLQDWTFAGANGGRLLYDYGELDSLLGGVNVDWFLLQILKVDPNQQPRGSIDCAKLHLTYRQHSLCAASNGGRLASQPPGGKGAEHLADGWKYGPGRQWQSQPKPTGPQTFEYAFKNPVTVMSVNVHNATLNPSKDIEVAVSEDGGATWTSVAQGELPKDHKFGPNFAFYHADAHVLVDGVAVWAPLHAKPVNRLRVQILSGYQDGQWGLGEIEAFGTGAAEQTEDDWYDVNQDILVKPGTWHFRIGTTTTAGTTHGPDQSVEVR
ncbi:MAG: hypothetical protein AB7O62_08295 [Pirellulales bacterium]